MTAPTEPTVTAEQVMAEGVTRRDAAQRLAEYANLRASGVRKLDAAQSLGLTTFQTAQMYERWLTKWRAEHGLPAIPPPTNVGEFSREKNARAVQSGNHNRWHVERGVTSPTCPLCAGSSGGAVAS